MTSIVLYLLLTSSGWEEAPLVEGEPLASLARHWAEGIPELYFEQNSQYPAGRFFGKLQRLEDWETIQEFKSRSSALLDQTELSSELRSVIESRERKRSSGTNRSSLQTTKKRSRTLHLELSFIEIRQSRMEQLGLRFGSPIQFTLEDFSLPDFNPLGSFLDLALQKGDARLHYKQSLVAQEGVPAHFNVGGEYAVRLIGSERSRIEKISYGIFLEFEARFVSEREVELRSLARVREPDLANGLDGLPLIQTKDLNSFNRLKLGQTVAIAGIYQLSKNAFRQSLPGVTHLPLFGSLLSSRSYQSQQTEAYIFVTPTEMIEGWRPQLRRP
jgi:Flp pilus assembly secretin CpaC